MYLKTKQKTSNHFEEATIKNQWKLTKCKCINAHATQNQQRKLHQSANSWSCRSTLWSKMTCINYNSHQRSERNAEHNPLLLWNGLLLRIKTTYLSVCLSVCLSLYQYLVSHDLDGLSCRHNSIFPPLHNPPPHPPAPPTKLVPYTACYHPHHDLDVSLHR